MRRDFEALRERVLASVRANLGARGIVLDHGDLEACYSMAWQGLYMALMEGQEIESPAGWLTKVCYRRAIDEHRQRTSEQQRLQGATIELQGRIEPDLAGALDDRVQLRQTFEALRQQLDEREQQAASLCYLQGLSRAQAAERMGISEARMRKLMEGRGPERPGVAAKVDALLQTIQGGGWCEQQASLMRGLAFGVHDPNGERYRLAQLHRRECPACRAYVISLRGLAAVLPPLALPWAPGMAGLGGALGGGAGSSVAGVGGAAGGGAAGGWLPLGGSLSVKFATGCLLAAGVGGGCVALVTSPGNAKHAFHSHDLARGSGPPPSGATPALPTSLSVHPTRRRSSARVVSFVHPPRSRSSAHAVPAAGAAQRELGFEPIPKAQTRTASESQTRTVPSHSAASEFGPG
jgi:RNA polymerase sigma factor (sigma-70 family)